MERRREERIDAQQPALVSVLDDTGRQLSAQVVNCSGRGICLTVADPVPPGSVVRIDIDATLLLGEVTYCRSHAGEFRLGVEIEQMLSDTLELAKLMQGILGETSRDRARRTIHR